MTAQSPTTSLGPGTTTGRERDLHDPAYQAFLLLRSVFTVAPILFGLDKFTDVLTDWPRYLADTGLAGRTAHVLVRQPSYLPVLSEEQVVDYAARSQWRELKQVESSVMSITQEVLATSCVVYFVRTHMLRIGLTGGIGAGKSTVLKVVSALLQPTRGVIRLDGEVISGSSDVNQAMITGEAVASTSATSGRAAEGRGLLGRLMGRG